MAWVKLDDQFPEHPKVAEAGPLALAMQVAGLCYCNRKLTDGHVPRAVARTLLDWEIVNGDGKVFRVSWSSGMVGDHVTCDWVIDLLVDTGMWHEPGHDCPQCPDVQRGYYIHGYLDHQPSKSQVEDEREAKRRAGRKGGKASAKARTRAGGQAGASPPAQALAEARAQANPKQNPTPVPVPVNPPPARARESATPAESDPLKRVDENLQAWLDRRPPLTTSRHDTRKLVTALEAARERGWGLSAIADVVERQGPVDAEGVARPALLYASRVEALGPPPNGRASPPVFGSSEWEARHQAEEQWAEQVAGGSG